MLNPAIDRPGAVERLKKAAKRQWRRKEITAQEDGTAFGLHRGSYSPPRSNEDTYEKPRRLLEAGSLQNRSGRARKGFAAAFPVAWVGFLASRDSPRVYRNEKPFRDRARVPVR